MKWYVYKCNAKNVVGPQWGDWHDFFKRTRDGRRCSWGSPEFIKDFDDLVEGDQILSYQTNLNSLMGWIEYVGLDWNADKGLDCVYFRPRLRLGPDGVKVRPMKKINETIAEIWAFKTNQIKTLYPIKKEDAECILRVAQNRCAPKLIERWD